MILSNTSRKIILLLGDIFVLYASLFLTLVIRYVEIPNKLTWDAHKWAFFFVYGMWIISFYIAGLYDAPKARISYLAKNMAINIGMAILLFYLIPYFYITPKTNLFIDGAIVSILIWLWRKAFRRLLIKGSKIKVFLMGKTKEEMSFAKIIDERPDLGFKVIDNISESNIVIASTQMKQNPELVRSLYGMVLQGKTIIDFERFYESLTGKVPISTINEVWFLENLSEINKQKFEKVKRWIDIAIACLLGIPFVVIFPFVAAAIKLSSPGPIFYKQKRLGRNGKEFQIIKFRSMIDNAEKEGARWAEKRDRRITFAGNIMRKIRIDELPQIWNVIRGDISLVGPRPERPEFVKDLVEKIPHYSMRHLVKPGLSGWAQINFPYGSSIEDSTQKLQYDLYYIKNRTLVLEIAIMLKTIMSLIRIEGR